VNPKKFFGELKQRNVIGLLNDRTHSLTASFAFIALAYVAAVSLILSLKIRDPLELFRGSKSGGKTVRVTVSRATSS
jgi:hypothetical protein